MSRRSNALGRDTRSHSVLFDEFDYREFRGIAVTDARFRNARVSAVAFPQRRSDLFHELLDDGRLGDELRQLTASAQVVRHRGGDETLGDLADLFGFGRGRLDLLVFE